MKGQPRETAMQVEKRRDTNVVCPHCEFELSSVEASPLNPTEGGVFGFGKRYVYSCPSCHKVLGVSHRKGFWMG